jgi:hypothetical protein
MPLFRRSDGDLVTEESPLRGIMPYVMRGRNECLILHEATYEIAKTRAFLRAFNHEHAREQPATMFQLFLWLAAQGLHERLGLNRFVSGGRLYQRKGIQLSFAAKKDFRDDAPIVSVKLDFWKGEPFADCCKRIASAIVDGRSGPGRSIDKEVELLMKLPGPLLTLVVGLGRWLDRFNLMPRQMIENDPLYTSLFVGNLGSVGLDRTYHHLYEQGTCAMFAVMGTPKKAVVVGRNGQPEVKDVLDVRWSLDERVNDGYYCAKSLALFKKMFEDPEPYVRAVTGGAASSTASPEAPSAESA